MWISAQTDFAIVRKFDEPETLPDANAVANAIGYAEHRSRSHDAVIRVYDAAGNMIETHEHKSDFREW